jgi:hypothetical protein
VAQEPTTEQDLNELENRLERLRVLYEQYFMGLEKREPGVARKDVERRMQLLRKVRFPSTAVRFRFQTTVQRYNTLQQYWGRVCREIEAGTYRRHVLRAEKRFHTEERASDAAHPDAKEQQTAAAEERVRAANDLSDLLENDVDLDAEMRGVLAALEKSPTDRTATLGKLGKRVEGAPAPVSPSLQLGKLPQIRSTQAPAQPSISPTRAVSPKPKGLELLAKRTTTTTDPLAARKAPVVLPPPAAPPPKIAEKKAPPPAPSMRPKPSPASTGLSVDRIQALHASYVEARKKTNASAVSYEKLERNLRETEKKLREVHKGKQVDFEVTIKDGKAILKPRLK